MLLHHIRRPKSFKHLKTINGRECETYREACNQLGLLEDDSHWDATLTEASVSSSGPQLRTLFSIMLHNCDLSNPKELWEKHKENLSEDLLHQLQWENPGKDIPFSDSILNQALILIVDKIISIGSKPLKEIGLQSPIRNQESNVSLEILWETCYNIKNLQQFVAEHKPQLHQEQKTAYENIVQAIQYNKGGILFLDAAGGTGKTFIINLLLAKVHYNKQISLAVASSGSAATLLTGGRTAHSTFKLPIQIHTDEPTCDISKGTGTAKLLQQCCFIVWDECTMAHKK